ncbi:MAG: hypothetical protein MJZ03_02030 [archaeon]|nr:hypothetical protein [archaeon]
MSTANKTRMLVLGGYLGAGKTTLAVNLARYLKKKHNKFVSIIMNDQGNVLVDTEYSRNAGFNTNDITGGCFCTNFDKFILSARTLVSSHNPDVIIAEPIGTSTNVMSSVIAPMKLLHPDEFSISPFVVVVDCVRALSILSEKNQKNVDTVSIIPTHQIRDAEVIILTKTDLVSKDTISEIRVAIEKIISGIRIIETSSMDLRNIDDIVNIILSDEISTKTPSGEKNSGFVFEKAKLGWYSGTFNITPSENVDMYSLETELMKRLAMEYDCKSIVHVKVLIESPEAVAKMSLVQETMQVDDVYGSRYIKTPGRLILNARVISPPKRLKETITALINSVVSRYSLEFTKVEEECFTPKPESPTHFFFE